MSLAAPRSTLTLRSPLAGWVSGLAEVPDPAFAQGMIGDGVAIDPMSSELCAPCDGVVVSVHAARHACTVRAPGGAEIMLHVGIDTVGLKGRGFRVLVRDGQRVRAGDPLIAFDMDLVGRGATSLHTMVVVVNGDDHAIVDRVQDREVAVGDPLLVIAAARGGDAAEPAADADADADAGDAGASGASEAAERRAVLPLAHGMHARPAAVLARSARRHAGPVAISCRGRSASGKSLVSLMALGARRGDVLAIRATGPGAENVAAELAELVESGLGEAIPDPAQEPEERGDATPFRPGQEVRLAGVAAAPGLAVGVAVRLASEPDLETDLALEPEAARAAATDGTRAAAEEERLGAARARLRREIEQVIAAAPRDATRADIFRAHLDLVDDPELVATASREIAAGRSAAAAWRTAIRESAAALRGPGDPLLWERTADLEDLGRRTLAILAGRATSRVPAELPDGAVLVADEILPSDLAALPAGAIAGLCTARGGPTSHAAILAAGLGVPAVVAIGDAVLRVPDGAPLVVDGGRGAVRVFPAAGAREVAEGAIAARAHRRRAGLAAAREEARTADGTRVAVMANLERPSDAALAVAQGAEGCGLLRTEILFLDRSAPPSEDEQAACYQAMADALEGRPLVVRLFDGGGDKRLPYLPAPREDNPALGVRGVRLALLHPRLLRAQLRAILRARPAGVCRILVPMIATAAELRAVRAAVDEERRALDLPAPAIGAMIEVPVAALLAATLAREADFFSIGTNDLAQYALAMDRGNPLLAGALDALHPGVLRLVAGTAVAARACARPVAVCGGAAGDPRAVPLLIGLGIGALSTAPALVAETKALVRTLTAARCAEVANRALELESGEDVRALVAETWPELAGEPPATAGPAIPPMPQGRHVIGGQSW
ncbi:MAG TPA: phosphoenolpyruvate--protein phosphotransferase [Kofleriaceae bacterium]|nr:phosphoenolpyruvate--protein phosphotransferase [Kofleriaceae bacterium]